VTLYQGVASTVLSLSESPTLSLLSHFVEIDIRDAIDIIDAIDTINAIDVIDAFKV
jgi:ACT domain-containing protein